MVDRVEDVLSTTSGKAELTIQAFRREWVSIIGSIRAR